MHLSIVCIAAVYGFFGFWSSAFGQTDAVSEYQISTSCHWVRLSRLTSACCVFVSVCGSVCCSTAAAAYRQGAAGIVRDRLRVCMCACVRIYMCLWPSLCAAFPYGVCVCLCGSAGLSCSGAGGVSWGLFTVGPHDRPWCQQQWADGWAC